MPNKLRVVHFISGPYLKSDWIYTFITSLKKYVPVVYCFGLRNIDKFPVKFIRSFETLKKFDPRFIVSLLYDRPSVIHAHFGPSGYDFLFYKLILRLPMVTSFYGADLSALPKTSLFWKLRYKILFYFGDRFLAMGSHMQQSLISYGCPSEKIIVYPLGIRLNKIRFKPRVFIKNQAIKLLYCGRLAQKKGVPDLVEAFHLLQKLCPHRKLALTLACAINNDIEQLKEKHIILEKIKKYHLAKKVSFSSEVKPYKDYVNQLYQYHIFISPSVVADNGDDEGGYILSLLEASASGMPVVSTLHCDIPDTIIEGQTGFLIPEHRPDLLANKLKILIDKPKTWPTLGSAGRKLVEKKYDSEKLIPALERIYDETIKYRHRR